MSSSRKKKVSVDRKNLSQENRNLLSSKPRRGRIWLFRILSALGIPVLLIGTVELGLRATGFGYPTHFLLPLKHNGQEVWIQNNRFGWRFFGAAMARMPRPFCIPQTKNPGTVRILVFGESAALGDPEPRFGLSRMLQSMLELRYPGKQFEVVNTAMVAINSNVILPIAQDCACAHADIWVIYMGNNEVVGPFGAGTVFGQQVPPRPLIRANLALKSTRTGQLIDTLRAHFEKPPIEKSEWGGMEMFLQQQVRADDPRMNTVYDDFAKNLSDIINLGEKSHAEIVVSTVAVNLRDCAPFASEHRPGLTKPDQTSWDQSYQNGVAAQTHGRIAEAAKWYVQAAQLDDQFAELRFRQGCCALELGQTADAQKHFAAARDLDTLRFRCDTILNNSIRRAALDRNDPHVLFADAEKAFAEQSPNGLPGNDLFYEHVHLTLHGNYLLARTIASQIQNLLPPQLAAQTPASTAWPSENDCARRLAWSDLDKQKALTDIHSRLRHPPFTRELNHDAQVQQLELWLSKLTSAPGPAGIQAAISSCEYALNLAPNDAVLHEKLAELDELTGDLKDAETNAAQAVAQLPGSSEDWSHLGVIFAKQKKYEEGVAAFRRAFDLNPEDVWTLQNLAQSLKDLGRTDEAIREYRHALAVKPRFGLAWLRLGETLEQTGHETEAEQCYQKALQNPIDRAPELTTLARFCETHGWREAAATNYSEAMTLDSFNPSLQIEAAQNLSVLGRHTEAEQHFAEATRLSPDSIEAHFLYGMELGHNGKAADAVTQFREAVRIQPDMLEARLNLGLSLVDAQNYSEALLQFNKVLERDPTNTKALQYANALRQQLSAGPPR